MSVSSSISLIKLDPPDTREDEWNKWYTEVHSPGRFECGFLAFRRFVLYEDDLAVDTVQPNQAKYLALMELPNTQVLTSQEYDAITEKWVATPPDSFEHLTMTLPKFARGVFDLTGTYPAPWDTVLPDNRYVFLSAHDVPSDISAEFDEWYVEEHMPLVLNEPGFLSVRRYKHLTDEFPPMLSRGGELFSHLSIWEIDGPQAFQNPKFTNYTVTPWQKRMRGLCKLKVSNIYSEIARGLAP